MEYAVDKSGVLSDPQPADASWVVSSIEEPLGRSKSQLSYMLTRQLLRDGLHFVIISVSAHVVFCFSCGDLPSYIARLQTAKPGYFAGQVWLEGEFSLKQQMIM
jgi:hypothetical protein